MRLSTGALPTLLLLALTLPGEAQQPAASSSGLTAAEIIARLQERNQVRNLLLAEYSVLRRYHLWNELSGKRSEMEVRMTFRQPDQLGFETLRQSGSGFLAKRVFGGMMKAEREALLPENKRRSAINPDNYEFTRVAEEPLNGRRTYVLELKPRRKDTYLIEGRIWIDAEDFAVVRAAGRPSKRPSVWTRKVDIVRAHRKVGPFWLPDRLETVNEVLLFGETRVGIDSRDYRIHLRQAAFAPPPQ